MMIGIIPAAGRSQRFFDAGYSGTKAALPMPPSGHSLLAMAAASMPVDVLLVIAQRQHMPELQPVVSGLGAQSLWLDHYTDGPLATLLCAEYALQRYGEYEGLVVYVDNYLRGGLTDFVGYMRRTAAPSGAVVFRSTNPRFGYWTDAGVVEKRAVSDFAVAGMFYFSSVSAMFRDGQARLSHGAGLPALMDAESVPYLIDEDDLVDVGVPEDYEAYMEHSR